MTYYSDNACLDCMSYCMQHVTKIDLDETNLVGYLPSELGLLQSLQTLVLAYNTVTGTLPSEIGRLGDSLVVIDFETNAITGTLPSEYGAMTSLEEIWMSYNSIGGTIATEVGLMSSLRVFDFIANDFTGTGEFGS